MKPLLILVDLQRDYLSAPEIEPPSGTVVHQASALLQQCREIGAPVAHVWTTVAREPDHRMPHWKAADRWRCEANTPGHAPPPALEPRDGERVFHKTAFSGFTAADLGAFVREQSIDTLIVAGVNTHACVRQTVLDAYQSGLAVWVAADAVGSDDPVHAAITRRYLEARGVRFAPTAALAAELREPKPIMTSNGRHDQVRATIDLANASRETWTATPHAARIQLVGQLVEVLAHHVDEFADVMARELGKPVRFGKSEVQRSAQMLSAIIRRCEASSSARATGPAVVRRRPHGVVAVITPWNNPIYLPLGKIVPAILHGNTVVWKPAPQAREASSRILDCMRESDWPATLVGLVQGDRREAEEVMSDPAIAAVTLTGSSAAGYSAQEICARRRVPLQAELGGNNAAVVWLDANLEESARLVAAGAFEMAGQRCTANRRVIVHADCRERFLQLLQRETAALNWGDPQLRETQIGPLVDAESRNRIAAAVERAVGECGSALLPLGSAPPKSDGHAGAWYPPTILCCDDPAHEIVQEETFGPVLVVQTARDWNHAMRLCNGVRQGLAAAIFTNSQQPIERFLDEAQAGILKVNQSTADADVDVPFGGWKSSGLGPPEHGEFDREFYTRPQVVYGAPTGT